MTAVISKLEKGKELKIQGNEAFKAENYKKALTSYHHAVLYLKGLDNEALNALVPNLSDSKLPDDLKAEIKTNMIQTLTNIAVCYLKLERFDDTIAQCDKVLALDDKNAKALFRKGIAYRLGERNLIKAESLLLQAAKLSPQDVGIRKELISIREEIKTANKESADELRRNLQKSMN